MGTLADPHASRAVLVGTATYTQLSPLPAVAGNLAGLAGALADERCWGLPADRCRSMLDPADPREVGRVVRQAAATVADDGLLLVYVAGHGLIGYDGRLVLALPDTEAAFAEQTGLPYDWIRRSVAESPARRRVVVLDCCYAGRADGAMAADVADGTGTDAVADQAEIEGACLLVSAPRNRTAQAPPGHRYTAFTGELLRVLCDGQPGGPPLLDVTTIWRTVRRSLQAKGYERPELRTRDAGGDIPLVRNRAVPQTLAGCLLAAAPYVTDPEHRQAAVLVLRHDAVGGALGLRLDRPTRRPAHDASAGLRQCLTDPAVVFHGGPVSTDAFIALALLRRTAPPPVRFAPVRDRLGTVALTAEPALVAPALARLRLFSGYLGWGPGELEEDLASGLLRQTSHPVELALSERPERLWTALQRPA
ncbi:MAG TPA: YqgE/AlgH family protein [Pilimelia sp.]|nr:YqgE/AlgH family protein [Pilimelia sp.]